MPYVKAATRVVLEENGLERLALLHLEAGDVAYCIWRLLARFVALNKVSFKTYASVLGILEAVKLEMYRAVVGPYEITKMIENGDV